MITMLGSSCPFETSGLHVRRETFGGAVFHAAFQTLVFAGVSAHGAKLSGRVYRGLHLTVLIAVGCDRLYAKQGQWQIAIHTHHLHWTLAAHWGSLWSSRCFSIGFLIYACCLDALSASMVPVKRAQHTFFFLCGQGNCYQPFDAADGCMVVLLQRLELSPQMSWMCFWIVVREFGSFRHDNWMNE